MFTREKKTRKFQYTPFFYDKDKDQEEKKSKQVSFHHSQRYTKKGKSYIRFLLLLCITIFLFYYLGKLRLKIPEEIEIINMEVVK